MQKIKNLLFPVSGFLALLWFLIRVIPKPSRAFYPCQRAAFPVATAFVAWVIGICSSVFLIKCADRKRIVLPLVVFLIAIIWSFTVLQSPNPFAIAQDEPFSPIDAPNSPIGEAKGVCPGRVVWSYNPAATSWSGSGYWWQEKNNDVSAIEKMFSQSLQALTETHSDAAAWTALFQHFNDGSNFEYGEKIAVKLNLNACNDHGSNKNRFFSHPLVVLVLARQLVSVVGLDPADLIFYDATRFVPSSIYDLVKNEFPDVIFADFEGKDGRKKISCYKNVQVKWSQELSLETDAGNPAWLPQCVVDADYLINLGQLKGHNLAGVTLNAKNWFGSFVSYPANGIAQSSSPKNAGVHPYVCVHDDFHFGGHWDFEKREMATYNSLVDLMGHKHLGQKTVLFLIDGLYSAPDQSTELKTSCKWKSVPFNNDWPSSLFMSQDMVAIESVALDFIRNEAVQTWCRGNVDNYLHEAALAANSPSGIQYDPEQDGSTIKSLGVHEHWNNPQDKQYSRNLGTGNGIELFRAETWSSVQEEIKRPESFSLEQNFPNPFNNSTTLRVNIDCRQHAVLDIFDANGRMVKSIFHGELNAGVHQFYWDGISERGNPVCSGVYYARLVNTENSVQEIQKMVLVK